MNKNPYGLSDELIDLVSLIVEAKDEESDEKDDDNEEDESEEKDEKKKKKEKGGKKDKVDTTPTVEGEPGDLHQEERKQEWVVYDTNKGGEVKRFKDANSANRHKDKLNSKWEAVAKGHYDGPYRVMQTESSDSNLQEVVRSVVKKAGRRAAGSYGRPGSAKQKRAASKSARGKIDPSDYLEADPAMNPMGDAPYYVGYDSQVYEWYGDGPPSSGDGRWKPKGGGGVVAINIGSYETAQKIADKTDREWKAKKPSKDSIFDEYYHGAFIRPMSKMPSYDRISVQYQHPKDFKGKG